MRKALPPLGQVAAVIGAQWGDEGKGKIFDVLSDSFDVIARACGGANAGHTIVVNGTKHVFRLLPSGCLHEGKPVYLGSGMVLHLPTLLEEIAALESAGSGIVDRLYLSPAAHIVFEYHKDIDGVIEERRAKKTGGSIGTTRKGIGPAYADKSYRSGLRLETLLYSEDIWKTFFEEKKNDVQAMFGVSIDVDRECESLRNAKKILAGRITQNGPALINEWVDDGKRVLIEGAQATLLDIDHGTYPFVTSSATTAAGALQGLGIAPRALTNCIGVAKAYCTRVGAGVFLTEADESASQRLRERGGEYGSVTKRPRRCGWLYLPDLRFSALINGIDRWNITKLDVLDTEEIIPVGVGEKSDGSVQYEELPGWKTSTANIASFDALPKEARDFIAFIEEKTDIPVAWIGTGQAREAMIMRG